MNFPLLICMQYMVSVNLIYSEFFSVKSRITLNSVWFFYLATAMKQTLMSAESPQTCVEVVRVSTLLAALSVSALMATKVDLWWWRTAWVSVARMPWSLHLLCKAWLLSNCHTEHFRSVIVTSRANESDMHFIRDCNWIKYIALLVLDANYFYP